MAKKLGCLLKIKLRWLKEGLKCLMLSVEVPTVLYRENVSVKSSRRLPLFQLANFASSQGLATTVIQVKVTCSRLSIGGRERKHWQVKKASKARVRGICASSLPRSPSFFPCSTAPSTEGLEQAKAKGKTCEQM